MHATIRRYEGIDQSRTDELIKKVDDGLLTRLSARWRGSVATTSSMPATAS